MPRVRGDDVFDYALRITLFEPENLVKLSAFLSHAFVQWLVCREQAAEDHCHIYGRGALKLKGLQASFKKFFPDHGGNAGHSIKQCDSQVYDYLKYICKGSNQDTPPIIVSKQGIDFTDEYVAELHAAYWVSNAEIRNNSKKREHLKLAGTIVEQVEREAKQLKLSGQCYDREAVAAIYVKMYVDARKPVNVYHAKGVVNTVCALLSGASFDLLVSDCAQR